MFRRKLSCPSFQLKRNKMQETALYIHIPFCSRKCFYCDFVSIVSGKDMFQNYVDAVCKEIQLRKLDNVSLNSIYLGGGTPSCIPENLVEKIIKTIKKSYKISTNTEITIEVNPESATLKKLNNYFSYGINRLSIGAQSFNNEDLFELKRNHTVNDIENAFDSARSAGFKNINLDLIYGIKKQTLKNLNDSIKAAIYMEPEHISTYSLTIKDITLCDEDMVADMYLSICETLENNGYTKYEISNFAKQGKHSRHNLAYWENREYIGIGAAAHSYLSGIRSENTGDIDLYIKKILENGNAVDEFHQLTESQKEFEYIFLNLRTRKGIYPDEFQKITGCNFVDKYSESIGLLTKEDMLEQINGSYRLTQQGQLISNEIFLMFS